MEDLSYILLTGADGNLGGRLSKLLCDGSEYGVIAVSSFPEKIPEMISREQINHVEKLIQMPSEMFFNSDLNQYRIEGVVHFAFSRAIFPNKDIANSLDYSLAAFRKIAESNIPNAIYISSQSIYGDTPEWRTVETVPAPNSVYAMAKYAGEKLFEAVYHHYPALQHSILRLDIVPQSQNLIKALCRNVKETGILNLKGGKQVFSYLDITDVPGAIYKLLCYQGEWKPIYNVGWNRKRYTLIDIGNLVKEIAAENGQKVTINLNEDDSALWAGMDTELFIQDTGWKPLVDAKETIRRIYNGGK